MYDFIVVGGGIVGLSTALALGVQYPDIRIAILEKESDLAHHQTGNNSGVIHSGVYYKPGSLKAKLCREGAASMTAFCQKYGIAHEICSKVIVATRPEDLSSLENLYQRGLKNGIAVAKLTTDQVRGIALHISCLTGIRVFSTGIANYKQVCQRYLDPIEQHGVPRFNSCL